MGLPFINSRADLDALAGADHDTAMAMLAGTLWRLEKDDEAKTWRVVEDDSTIERLGLTRSDFPGATAPDVPEYVEPAVQVPQVVSRAQGKTALIQAGLWDQVVAFVNAIPDATQKALAEVALNDTTEWRRDSPFLTQAAVALGVTTEQMDALFVQAAEIRL